MKSSHSLTQNTSNEIKALPLDEHSHKTINARKISSHLQYLTRRCVNKLFATVIVEWHLNHFASTFIIKTYEKDYEQRFSAREIFEEKNTATGNRKIVFFLDGSLKMMQQYL